VITFQIVEGALSHISVEGNKWFRIYIQDRLAVGAGPRECEPASAELQLLQQDNRIRAIHAELRPGQAGSRAESERGGENPFMPGCVQQLPVALGGC
jgi:hypothetical protein